MVHIFRVVFCCLLLANIPLFGAAVNVGVDDPCAAFCDSNYKKPKDKQLAPACKDGCKAFFLEMTMAGPDRVKHCEESCVKAYDKRDLSDACVAGCRHQTMQNNVMVSFDKDSKLLPEASGKLNSMMGSFGNLFGSPMMGDGGLFSGRFSGMMNSMHEQMNKMLNWGSLGRIDDDPFGIETPDVEQPQPMVTVGNSDEFGEPLILVDVLTIPIEDDAGGVAEKNGNNQPSQPPPQPSFVVENLFNKNQQPSVYYEEDMLSCLNRRINHFSSMTRWMLCLALMLSIISMVWICLAILRTKTRRTGLPYVAATGKGGVENVYYTTPPFTVSDKSPMIIKTTDYKAQPGLEAPPPAYDVVAQPIPKPE